MTLVAAATTASMGVTAPCMVNKASLKPRNHSKVTKSFFQAGACEGVLYCYLDPTPCTIVAHTSLEAFHNITITHYDIALICTH